MNNRILLGILVIGAIVLIPILGITFFSPDAQMSKIYERNRLICEDYQVDYLKSERGEISNQEFIENEKFRLEQERKLLNETKNLPDSLQLQRLKSMLTYRIQGSEILISSYYENKNRSKEVTAVWTKSKREADLYIQES